MSWRSLGDQLGQIRIFQSLTINLIDTNAQKKIKTDLMI